MFLSCVGEDSWESLGLQGDQTSQSWRKSVLNVHWKDWCWSWNSNTLVTWCEELTHWKRPCCWERLKAGGEGDDRGWDGWIASPIRWTGVWASSGSWWWTGKFGVLQSTGSQRVGHDWATQLKLNWMGSPGSSDGKESACNTGDPYFLGQKNPLEKGMEIHSSILAWRIPWTEGSMVSQRVGQDWGTNTACEVEKKGATLGNFGK